MLATPEQFLFGFDFEENLYLGLLDALNDLLAVMTSALKALPCNSNHALVAKLEGGSVERLACSFHHSQAMVVHSISTSATIAAPTFGGDLSAHERARIVASLLIRFKHTVCWLAQSDDDAEAMFFNLVAMAGFQLEVRKDSAALLYAECDYFIKQYIRGIGMNAVRSSTWTRFGRGSFIIGNEGSDNAAESTVHDFVSNGLRGSNFHTPELVKRTALCVVQQAQVFAQERFCTPYDQLSRKAAGDHRCAVQRLLRIVNTIALKQFVA